MQPATCRRTAELMIAGLLLGACATAAPKAPPELVWPLPPEQPRIRYVDSLYRSDHFKSKGSGWLQNLVMGGGQAPGERLGKPLMVTVDDQERVYVSDTGGSRVWVFDRPGGQVRYLGDAGQGQLATPTGVAVDARGVVFVADAKHDRIFAYDQTGKVVMAIGKPGEFYSPSGLAVDRATGRLYVADAGRHTIRVYDTATGEFRFEFGSRGGDPGQFNYPTHLFFRAGRLYVTDTMNFRVQAFTPEGAYLRRFGQLGASLGQFSRPKGVGVDSKGHVYVVDAAFGNFQIFDQEGELLLFVGQTGFQAGEFYLPAGLFVDDRDRIYVVDQYNRRVQVFEYLGEVLQAKGASPASAAPR